MTEDSAIISLTQWFQAPAGRYLLDWEQRHLDQVVADLFGFHALQLGLVELDALRANRMPHRWVAIEGEEAGAPPKEAALPRVARGPCTATSMRCRSTATASISSCCRMRSRWPATRTSRCARSSACSCPKEGWSSSVSIRRACGVCASTWVDCAGCSGSAASAISSCPAPANSSATAGCATGCACSVSRSRPGASAATCRRSRSEKWLARFGWMEGTGDRWWPVFGAVYFIVAVKRVRGMRLVGLVRDQRAVPNATPAPATAAASAQGARTRDGTLTCHEVDGLHRRCLRALEPGTGGLGRGRHRA